MDDLPSDRKRPGLGAPQLERLWARVAGGTEPRAPSAAEWQAERLVIDGLGLGLQDALRFLHGGAPDLADFERWVLARNGGAIPPERIAVVNASVERALRGEAALEFEPGPGQSPLLDAADLRFWGDHGYVVVKGAVDRDGCRAAEAAIWDFLGMDPEAPEGWRDDSRCEGVMITLSRHPAFDANRDAPRIRAAFAQLLGSDDLQVTVDRGGFNPPERSGVRFRGAGLHWDTSLHPPIPLQLQGLVYLTDTPAEQGAFRCVPGFHRRIEGWLAGLPPAADPRAQDLSAEEVRVAGEAGDLVIWHAALPHGASPNRGARPRLVQYVSYYRPGFVDERPWL